MHPRLFAMVSWQISTPLTFNKSADILSLLTVASGFLLCEEKVHFSYIHFGCIYLLC